MVQGSVVGCLRIPNGKLKLLTSERRATYALQRVSGWPNGKGVGWALGDPLVTPVALSGGEFLRTRLSPTLARTRPIPKSSRFGRRVGDFEHSAVRAQPRRIFPTLRVSRWVEFARRVPARLRLRPRCPDGMIGAGLAVAGKPLSASAIGMEARQCRGAVRIPAAHAQVSQVTARCRVRWTIRRIPDGSKG